MKIEVIPAFEFTWNWFIALVARVFREVFAFVGEEEGWVEE